MAIRIKTSSLREGLVFFLLQVLFGGASLFFNCDPAIFILYVIYMLYFMQKLGFSLTIKYFWHMVMISMHVLSVFYVENVTTFFGNLQVYSYYTGALWPLVTAYLLFWETIRYLEENRDSRQNEISALNAGTASKNQIMIMTAIVLFGLIFMLFLWLRVSGNFYYTSGVRSRHDYQLRYLSGIGSKYTYMFYLIPLALMLHRTGKNKHLAVMFVGIILLYLVWVGIQFGSYFTVFYLLLIGMFATLSTDQYNDIGHRLTKKIQTKKTKKLVLLGVLAVIVLVGYFLSFRMATRGDSFADAIQAFVGRITNGQSDIWWSIHQKYKDSLWNFDGLWEEFMSCFGPLEEPAKRNFGIYKMMREVAPSSVLVDYFSRNVVFSASTQASLFYYFGYTGLFLGEIALAVVLFYIINGLCESIRNNRIIETIIFSRFLILYPQYSSMSSLRDLLGFDNLIMICVLLFLRKYKIKVKM